MDTESDPESQAAHEVIEVEAERLPLEDEQAGESPATGTRIVNALSPVIAGFIIDLVDAGTFGPIGLKLGLPIGALAGFWAATHMGLRGKARRNIALGAGIYCLLPMTSFLPLGTLLGALSRLHSVRR
jgi:hypothetical protein